MGQGAGAFDRTRPPKITFGAATSDRGVFEFVNEGTVARGIVAFASGSDWQFSAEPSTLVGYSCRGQVCMVYHINAQQKIYRIHEYTDVASLMRPVAPRGLSFATSGTRTASEKSWTNP